MSDPGSARLSPLAVVAQATFVGCVAIVKLSRTGLRGVLPTVVHLPGADTPSVDCLLLFGEHRYATTCVAGFPMPWGIRYHELMVAVPYVSLKDGRTPHLFVHRMICDYWPAVWVGNGYYGFSKSFARIEWDGKRFRAADAAERHVLSAELLSDQPATLEALAWIESAARLPVLGTRGTGSLVLSRFEWDLATAQVSRTTLQLTWGQGFHGLLSKGDRQPLPHAYRIDGMRWRLSWPFPATPPGADAPQ